MAILTGYLNTTTFGQVPGVGNTSNRENLEDWITNLDRTETPLIASIGSEDVTGIRVDWQTETMRNPRTNATTANFPMVAGNEEGKQFAAEAMPLIVRKSNVCQIFETFWGLTRTQITIAKKGGTAGIRGLAAHYSKKVMAELLTAVEARIFSTLTPAGTPTGDRRLMKTLDDATAVSGMLISMTTNGQPGNTNLGFGQNLLTIAAIATEANFRSVLRACWRGGVRVSDIHLSPVYKQQVSNTFIGYGATAGAPMARQVDKREILAVVDTFETDAGRARLVANIWVTEEEEPTGSEDVTIGTTAGRIWFLQRDMLKLGWLDRFQTNVMGKVGDGIGFQTVGELTLIVKTDRMGVIKGALNPPG